MKQQLIFDIDDNVVTAKKTTKGKEVYDSNAFFNKAEECIYCDPKILALVRRAQNAIKTLVELGETEKEINLVIFEAFGNGSVLSASELKDGVSRYRAIHEERYNEYEKHNVFSLQSAVHLRDGIGKVVDILETRVDYLKKNPIPKNLNDIEILDKKFKEIMKICERMEQDGSTNHYSKKRKEHLKEILSIFPQSSYNPFLPFPRIILPNKIVNKEKPLINWDSKRAEFDINSIVCWWAKLDGRYQIEVRVKQFIKSEGTDCTLLLFDHCDNDNLVAVNENMHFGSVTSTFIDRCKEVAVDIVEQLRTQRRFS